MAALRPFASPLQGAGFGRRPFRVAAAIAMQRLCAEAANAMI